MMTMDTPKVETDISPSHTDTEDSGDLIVEELLVEEISIDGMCGVY
jgi:mycofactocin precursor